MKAPATTLEEYAYALALATALEDCAQNADFSGYLILHHHACGYHQDLANCTCHAPQMIGPWGKGVSA